LKERVQSDSQNLINSLCKELKRICENELLANLTEEEVNTFFFFHVIH